MKKSRIFLVFLAAVSSFLLVYSPHYLYRFPLHVDEWHHITETLKLQLGGYSGGANGLRLGFHILLLPLAKITDLVLSYKFLPAIWSVVSVLVLFFTVYKKTKKDFFTALMAAVFFISIKSNVNITGLWFFTPLTFSIPFIFLYIYFFTEGFEQENIKFILISFSIMVFLLFVHAISVLFALPFLLIYSLCNFWYIKKEWRFFLLFLAIPLVGMIFYKFMMAVPWPALLNNLIVALQFKYGWGQLEINNSFFELYSFLGYILAISGIIAIFSQKGNFKKYFIYLLWTSCVFLSIIFFKFFHVSYLAPYQRNLYYFAISLPVLSALGISGFLKWIGKVSKMTTDFFIAVIIILTFLSYWQIPKQIDLYECIDENDYRALLFLSNLPGPCVVMARPGTSEAIYPVSGHFPVATYYFYGKRSDAEEFFNTQDCKVREAVIKRRNVKYVLVKFKINCGWELIYDKGDYIYEIK